MKYPKTHAISIINPSARFLCRWLPSECSALSTLPTTVSFGDVLGCCEWSTNGTEVSWYQPSVLAWCNELIKNGSIRLISAKTPGAPDAHPLQGQVHIRYQYGRLPEYYVLSE